LEKKQGSLRIPSFLSFCSSLNGREEKLEKTMVSDMDHLDWFDHLTSVYVAPLDEGIKIEGINKDIFQEKYPLDPLVNVMDELLSPGGCPWDREQDHLSLKPYLIEETYEVIEAIDCLNMDKLREELGDLLLQIVFHAALAQRRGDFDLNNVIEEITAKMIRRHPHVFGEVTVNDSNDVLKNWEQIKKEEKGNNIKRDRIMGTLNRSLPSLLMAEEVQKKAKKVGFDWQDIQGPLNKVKEEFAELEEVLSEEFRSGEGKIKAEDELGDLLFSVVNLARFIRISPEAALYKTVQKFIRRFNYIEDEITKNNTNWDQMDLKSLDNLWEMAKIKGL
jgi:tetrapyrrole methylase family protein/MazG family protein